MDRHGELRARGDLDRTAAPAHDRRVRSRDPRTARHRGDGGDRWTRRRRPPRPLGDKPTLSGRGLTSTAIVAATVTLLLALYPAVLPSTIDSAYDLTVHNASSTDYTLTIMAWAAGIFLPIVLAYQAWTYWIFAMRIGAVHSPAGPRADRAASEEADASR